MGAIMLYVLLIILLTNVNDFSNLVTFMKHAEAIRLLGKRLDILEKLREREFYVSELAKELGKQKPEISKYLRELEDNGLVEHEQKEGGRRKYYRVTEYAKKILEAINQVTQPIELGPKKVEEWQINEFLNVLEDADLSDDVRLSYSKAFHGVCTEQPTEIIDHEGVQRLFEKVADDPFHDKATENLARSVSITLPHALQDEKGSKWVTTRLYPILIKNVGNKNEENRKWTIRQLGKIAGLSRGLAKREVVKKFLQIWFSDDMEPNSESGKEVKLELVNFASKELFKNVKAKAKDPNTRVKGKAEILFKELTQFLKPR
jgi:DNA-binding MarR family transcriptional regulator